jgi:very-short-patch-repair endonuclease
MSDDAIDRLHATMDADLNYAVRSSVEQLREFVDSPIELMFVGAFFIGMRLSLIQPSSSPLHTIGLKRDGGLSTPHFDEASLKLVTQYHWRSYRIDFACFMKRQPDTPLVLIECDGHEFHERTADQAERDRSRDREIQQAGIPILRFTGREIYRDPFDCVRQTINFLEGRV